MDCSVMTPKAGRLARWASIMLIGLSLLSCGGTGGSPQASGGAGGALTDRGASPPPNPPSPVVRASTAVKDGALFGVVRPRAVLARGQQKAADATLNADVLPGEAGLDNPREIAFNALDSDIVLDIEPSTAGQLSGRVWEGKAVGDDLSLVTIVENEGVFVGAVITQQSGSYQFMSNKEGSGVQVWAVDALPKDDCGVMLNVGSLVPAGIKSPNSKPSGHADTETPESSLVDGSFHIVDIHVTFTTGVQTAVGSAVARTICEAAVAQSNACLKNSGVNVRLRLVGMASNTYVTSNKTPKTVIDAVSDYNQGVGKAIYESYNPLGADVSVLICEGYSDADTGGIANLPTAAEPLSFVRNNATVTYTAALGNLSFIHELGHVFACQHDRDAQSANITYPPQEALYPWAYASRKDGLYRTIMAYRDGLTVPNTPRVPYFSSPDVIYPIPESNGSYWFLGSSTRRNAEAFFTSAATIAGYNPTITGTVHTVPLSIGWNQISFQRASVLTGVSVNVTVPAGGVQYFNAAASTWISGPLSATGINSLLSNQGDSKALWIYSQGVGTLSYSGYQQGVSANVPGNRPVPKIRLETGWNGVAFPFIYGSATATQWVKEGTSQTFASLMPNQVNSTFYHYRPGQPWATYDLSSGNLPRYLGGWVYNSGAPVTLVPKTQ